MTTNSQTIGQLLFTQLKINLDEVTTDQLADYTAVEYYLTVEDEPPPDAVNLEKVRRYLEAFHHLGKVENWEASGKVLLTRLDTPTKQLLHDQLGTWGYYSEQVHLYEPLIKNCDLILKVIALYQLKMNLHIMGRSKLGKLTEP
ncbi:hypothetical protein [Nostoc sp. ChiSLP03a]|uniref:hypothetical protein n=1 Tax=Nostoc sp. ChiSLP03a TaxID=3075380 RepID=UPI002AD38405|nr:hypothetical protein [Nostoc sp. ChiSLP03a]MDZ8213932.1 hypothetical protein [Nostoc sp. ChiSLP03a]